MQISALVRQVNSPSKLFMVFACLLWWLGAATALVAQEARSGAINGVVKSTEGVPLSQARVVLVASGRTTLTNAQGRFAFRNVPAGSHRLEAAVIGHAPAQQDLVVSAGGGDAVVELVLAPTPLSIEGIQVTGSVTGQHPEAITQATSQLGGKALEREMAGTVAQTLESQPGIAVRYNGPAAAVPVIRGLTGDRILVLQDGQRTADLAGSADDHAVTIDPLIAQRIEVVRGPATLLYGNNALGGVVNVISNDVPTNVPARPEWLVAAQTESAQPGGGGVLRVNTPLRENWALTFRAGGRRTGDVRIGDDPVLGDRLENTRASSRDAAVGIGHVGERVVGGGSLKAYQFSYGLPLPPGSEPVSLRGRRFEGAGRAEIDLRSTLFPALRVDAAGHDYTHDELDGAGDVQLAFALQTQTVNVLLRQGPIGPFTDGAWGASGLFKQYASTGPAALTPAADSRSVGVFGFQELALHRGGPALQIGGRWDRYGIASESGPKFGPGTDRTFQALSGSVGLRVPIVEGISSSVSLARSFRAPTVEELFSGAPHAGTGSVEFGNPGLDAERGYGIEGVVRVRNGRWNGLFAAYRNTISNYVHLAARGDTIIKDVKLPVFTYAQDDATLRGVEGSLEWAARDDLVLGFSGDLLRAEQEDGTPLSFMPPARVGGSIRWELGAFSVGGDTHHEFAQNRVGSADELPTDPHTVFRAHAAIRFTHGGSVHSVTLRGENLTDDLHREATSRIKDFAPNPGRNIALLYRVFF